MKDITILYVTISILLIKDEINLKIRKQNNIISFTKIFFIDLFFIVNRFTYLDNHNKRMIELLIYLII